MPRACFLLCSLSDYRLLLLFAERLFLARFLVERLILACFPCRAAHSRSFPSSSGSFSLVSLVKWLFLARFPCRAARSRSFPCRVALSFSISLSSGSFSLVFLIEWLLLTRFPRRADHSRSFRLSRGSFSLVSLVERLVLACFLVEWLFLSRFPYRVAPSRSFSLSSGSFSLVFLVERIIFAHFACRAAHSRSFPVPSGSFSLVSLSLRSFRIQERWRRRQASQRPSMKLMASIRRSPLTPFKMRCVAGSLSVLGVLLCLWETTARGAEECGEGRRNESPAAGIEVDEQVDPAQEAGAGDAGRYLPARQAERLRERAAREVEALEVKAAGFLLSSEQALLLDRRERRLERGRAWQARWREERRRQRVVAAGARGRRQQRGHGKEVGAAPETAEVGGSASVVGREEATAQGRGWPRGQRALLSKSGSQSRRLPGAPRGCGMRMGPRR